MEMNILHTVMEDCRDLSVTQMEMQFYSVLALETEKKNGILKFVSLYLCICLSTIPTVI